MGKGGETISILLRMKPLLGKEAKIQQPDFYTVEQAINPKDKDVVKFRAEEGTRNDEVINNTKLNHGYKFNKIFEQRATQEDIWRSIQPAVDSALEGYNATIFAYGQTGSGKTYTITGSEQGGYESRGMLPRALAHIYGTLKKRTDLEWTTRISYLQIYKETGQDLLNHGLDARTLEDLPKVTVQEHNNEVVLKGLDSMACTNETDAMECLFSGETNRMYCETSMNRTSSRSHCIFTVAIETKRQDSHVVRRSKLHVVDLAGSERVSKTGADGEVLEQACYINKSLLYLQQVIVHLQEKSEHIPYRNSMMTQVLRDSLGGNCRTIMIATCHSTYENLGESLSTCGFAQRVASIKQDAKINEETDPKILIAKLRAENYSLRQALIAYQEGKDPGEIVPAPVDSYGDSKGGGEGLSDAAERRLGELQSQVKSLQDELDQRDKELRLIAEVVAKLRGSGAVPVPEQPPDEPSPQSGRGTNGTVTLPQIGSPGQTTRAHPEGYGAADPRVREQAERARARAEHEGRRQEIMRNQIQNVVEEEAGAVSEEALEERVQKFEEFRKSYRSVGALDNLKAGMGPQIERAKELADLLKNYKADMLTLRSQLADLKADRFAREEEEETPQEIELSRELDSLRALFNSTMSQLKEMKHTIEYNKRQIKAEQERMMRDFDKWWAQVQKDQQARKLLKRRQEVREEAKHSHGS